ncbi:MAG: lipopolysaccharide biosynthesis [Pseudomonadota bacterium]
MNGTVQFYWKLLLRRLPAMAVLFLLCTGLGLVLALRLPTTWATSARLLVEAPQISQNLAASTVQIEASEEIEIIRQQLLTRATLLDIAEDMNVFAPEEALSPDEVVEAMRDATRIRASGGASRRGPSQPTIVDVSFEARSGRIAAAVVNEYVTRITSANVRNRMAVAEDTMDFFSQEVERLSGELDRRSARISEFQRGNAEALPDGQGYRLNRQSLLQERVAAGNRELATLAEQRQRLTELFEATGRIGPGEQARRSPEEARLAELERELEDALTVYSRTNPRVVQLEARIAAARTAAAEAVGLEGVDEDADPQGMLYDMQVSEIDSRIDQTRTQMAEAEEELAELQTAIEQTPLNAITLAGLQRDYDNIRQQYDTAVSRASQASVGERIELTARGQRITLVESASVPTSPASPNRPLIAAAGVGAGLGLALALFLALEVLNGSVRRPVDIQNGLGIVPLATIPYIESSRRRLLRRSGQVAAMLVALIGVPAALWAVDTFYLPLDLLAQRLLDRVGLA